jgi:hypothetical protein
MEGNFGLFHWMTLDVKGAAVPPEIFLSDSQGIFFRPSALWQKTPPTCRRLRKTFRAGTCSRLNPFWKNHQKRMRQIKGSFGVLLWFIFDAIGVCLVGIVSGVNFGLVWGLFGIGLGFV